MRNLNSEQAQQLGAYVAILESQARQLESAIQKAEKDRDDINDTLSDLRRAHKERLKEMRAAASGEMQLPLFGVDDLRMAGIEPSLTLVAR